MKRLIILCSLLKNILFNQLTEQDETLITPTIYESYPFLLKSDVFAIGSIYVFNIHINTFHTFCWLGGDERYIHNCIQFAVLHHDFV